MFDILRTECKDHRAACLQERSRWATAKKVVALALWALLVAVASTSITFAIRTSNQATAHQIRIGDHGKAIVKLTDSQERIQLAQTRLVVTQESIAQTQKETTIRLRGIEGQVAAIVPAIKTVVRDEMRNSGGR